jgi:hypothetical protein
MAGILAIFDVVNGNMLFQSGEFSLDFFIG